jgi:hypothetical protein
MKCNFEMRKRNGVIELCDQKPAVPITLYDGDGPDRDYDLCQQHLEPLLNSRGYRVSGREA